MYVCIQPGICGTNQGHISGVSPDTSGGGPQTHVISEKGRFLRFVMTGLVPQGCVFEMQKGRPIVLLIRVLWTRIRRPIYA